MTIEQRLAAESEAWRPQVGETLIGEVVSIGERNSQFGEDVYPLLTVRTDEGRELHFHAFHTVARQELASQKPQIGDRIGIRYLGKPDGKKYEHYRIVVERAEPPAPMDWSDVGAKAEAELAAEDDGGIPF